MASEMDGACQWRARYFQHAGGRQGSCAGAASYGRLGRWGTDFALEFIDADGLRGLFGELAVYMPQRAAFFASIRFVVAIAVLFQAGRVRLICLCGKMRTR